MAGRLFKASAAALSLAAALADTVNLNIDGTAVKVEYDFISSDQVHVVITADSADNTGFIGLGDLAQGRGMIVGATPDERDQLDTIGDDATDDFNPGEVFLVPFDQVEDGDIPARDCKPEQFIDSTFSAVNGKLTLEFTTGRFPCGLPHLDLQFPAQTPTISVVFSKDTSELKELVDTIVGGDSRPRVGPFARLFETPNNWDAPTFSGGNVRVLSAKGTNGNFQWRFPPNDDRVEITLSYPSATAWLGFGLFVPERVGANEGDKFVQTMLLSSVILFDFNKLSEGIEEFIEISQNPNNRTALRSECTGLDPITGVDLAVNDFELIDARAEGGLSVVTFRVKQFCGATVDPTSVDQTVIMAYGETNTKTKHIVSHSDRINWNVGPEPNLGNTISLISTGGTMKWGFVDTVDPERVTVRIELPVTEEKNFTSIGFGLPSELDEFRDARMFFGEFDGESFSFRTFKLNAEEGGVECNSRSINDISMFYSEDNTLVLTASIVDFCGIRINFARRDSSILVAASTDRVEDTFWGVQTTTSSTTVTVANWNKPNTISGDETSLSVLGGYLFDWDVPVVDNVNDGTISFSLTFPQSFGFLLVAFAEANIRLPRNVIAVRGSTRGGVEFLRYNNQKVPSPCDDSDVDSAVLENDGRISTLRFTGRSICGQTFNMENTGFDTMLFGSGLSVDGDLDENSENNLDIFSVERVNWNVDGVVSLPFVPVNLQNSDFKNAGGSLSFRAFEDDEDIEVRLSIPSSANVGYLGFALVVPDDKSSAVVGYTGARSNAYISGSDRAGEPVEISFAEPSAGSGSFSAPVGCNVNGDRGSFSVVDGVLTLQSRIGNICGTSALSYFGANQVGIFFSTSQPVDTIDYAATVVQQEVNWGQFQDFEDQTFPDGTFFAQTGFAKDDKGLAHFLFQAKSFNVGGWLALGLNPDQPDPILQMLNVRAFVVEYNSEQEVVQSGFVRMLRQGESIRTSFPDVEVEDLEVDFSQVRNGESVVTVSFKASTFGDLELTPDLGLSSLSMVTASFRFFDEANANQHNAADISKHLSPTLVKVDNNGGGGGGGNVVGVPKGSRKVLDGAATFEWDFVDKKLVALEMPGAAADTWMAFGISLVGNMQNSHIVAATAGEGPVSSTFILSKAPQFSDEGCGSTVAATTKSFVDGVFRIELAADEICGNKFNINDRNFIVTATGSGEYSQDQHASNAGARGADIIVFRDNEAGGGGGETPDPFKVDVLGGDATLEFSRDDAFATFKLTYTAGTDRWISFGANNDAGTMIGSQIFSVNAGDNVVRFTTAEGVRDVEDPSTNIGFVQDSSVVRSNGQVIVTVTTADIGNVRLNLDGEVNMVFAAGGAGDANLVKGNKHAKFDLKAINLADGGVQGGNKKAMVLAHGAIMILVMLFIFPLGAMPSVFRDRGTLLDGQPAKWFIIHRGMQIFGCFMAIVSFFIIVTSRDTHFDEGHPVFGLIIIIVTFLQPFIAIFFRKNPGTRALWFASHLLFGLILTLGSAVVCLSGVELAGGLIGEDLQGTLKTVVFIGIVVVALCVVAVAYNRFCSGNRGFTATASTNVTKSTVVRLNGAGPAGAGPRRNPFQGGPPEVVVNRDSRSFIDGPPPSSGPGRMPRAPRNVDL